MQHRAGEIEDRPQVDRAAVVSFASAVSAQRVRLARQSFAGAQGGARRVERLAHRGDRCGPAELFDGERRRASALRISSTEGRARKAKIGFGGHRGLNSRAGKG